MPRLQYLPYLHIPHLQFLVHSFDSNQDGTWDNFDDAPQCMQPPYLLPGANFTYDCVYKTYPKLSLLTHALLAFSLHSWKTTEILQGPDHNGQH